MTSPPRDDFFTLVHKALRAGLLTLYVEAGRLDWQDADVVTEYAQRWGRIVTLFRSHAVVEDTYIWPLLEAKRPGAVAQMGIAHEPVESDLDVVDAAMQAAVKEPTHANGLTFYRALGWFTADMLDHLGAEEPAVMEMLWATCTDEELGRVRGQFMSTMDPQESAWTFELILSSSSRAEQLAVVGGMHAAMPPESFAGWLGGMSHVLPPEANTQLMSVVDEVTGS